MHTLVHVLSPRPPGPTEGDLSQMTRDGVHIQVGQPASCSCQIVIWAWILVCCRSTSGCEPSLLVMLLVLAPRRSNHKRGKHVEQGWAALVWTLERITPSPTLYYPKDNGVTPHFSFFLYIFFFMDIKIDPMALFLGSGIAARGAEYGVRSTVVGKCNNSTPRGMNADRKNNKVVHYSVVGEWQGRLIKDKIQSTGRAKKKKRRLINWHVARVWTQLARVWLRSLLCQ